MPNRTRLSVESLGDRCLPSFSPVTSFPAGADPRAVVTADFNNDGHLDLATSNYDEATGDGAVSVLLGNGGGSFQAAKTSATGPYPVSLAAGDFNADGKIDLATANASGYNAGVSILLGQSDGTFAAPVGVSAYGEFTNSVATGDMNADGKLDLVVSSGVLYGYVSVLLGHGDGTFADAQPSGEYSPFYSVTLADINGDGKLDVATTMIVSNAVAVFLGGGDGNLQEPRAFSAGIGATFVGPNSLAAGDFNADGKVDLATANNESNSVSMLLGKGNGDFQTAQLFPAGNATRSATASDVNGDGKLDLVVATPGTVSVLLGNGAGSLGQPIKTLTSTTGGSPSSLVMGDFNDDGRPDAAAPNLGSNNVAVLLNDGDWPNQNSPRLQIGDVTITEGNTGTRTATFTVTLSASSSQPITVAYATGGGSAGAGSDYQAASGTLTFAPGEATKTITVPIIGDRLPEPNETFAVNLSTPTNAIIADGQGVGTIVDDEPRVSIGDVTKKEGNGKKTTSLTFTITLSAAYDQPVTVSYRTVDGTATTGNNDYVAKSGTVTFLPGETTKTITITVKGDNKR